MPAVQAKLTIVTNARIALENVCANFFQNSHLIILPPEDMLNKCSTLGDALVTLLTAACDLKMANSRNVEECTNHELAIFQEAAAIGLIRGKLLNISAALCAHNYPTELTELLAVYIEKFPKKPELTLFHIVNFINQISVICLFQERLLCQLLIDTTMVTNRFAHLPQIQGAALMGQAIERLAILSELIKIVSLEGKRRVELLTEGRIMHSQASSRSQLSIFSTNSHTAPPDLSEEKENYNLEEKSFRRQ